MVSSKTKLFSLLLLLPTADAIKALETRKIALKGFVDLTLEPSRPETLVLAFTTVYDVIRWHDEVPTPLVWSIEGDALAEVP